MVKPTLFGGNLQISPADWKKASNLAKEGVKSRGIIAGLKKQITDFISKVAGLETKLKKYEGMGITEELRYINAMRRAPRRLANIVADIMRDPPETQAQQRTAPERRRSTGIEH